MPKNYQSMINTDTDHHNVNINKSYVDYLSGASLLTCLIYRLYIYQRSVKFLENFETTLFLGGLLNKLNTRTKT